MIKPYRACNCREPATKEPAGKRKPGKLLGTKCPQLKQNSKHGSWYARFEAPADGDGKRRQPRLGPFKTEKEAKDALVEALGEVKTGTHASDRATRLADYLPRWLEWKAASVKPSTLASYQEAAGLYFVPGLGHLRLGDLRESHIRELYLAMRKISRAEDDSELMRRLLAARATWHGKRVSTRPLTDARIRRMHAVLRAALNDASIPVNPAATVKLGKVRRARPLLWTQARTERWRKSGDVPAKVMVWTAQQCGQFLDAVEGQRLYALFHLPAYYGLRRGELSGLRWADVDLATRQLHVRGDVKSEDSDRIIIIDAATAKVLETWQEQQLFERLEWDAGWTDTGHVFTREDGRPVRPGWVSERFGTLAVRAGLPPISFHGLRHGAATMLLAAGVDIKVISEILGHATSAFTADVYTEVAEELADAAASAIAAFVPRKHKIVPGGASNVPAEGENDH